MSLMTHATVMYVLPWSKAHLTPTVNTDRPQEYFVAIEPPPPELPRLESEAPKAEESAEVAPTPKPVKRRVRRKKRRRQRAKRRRVTRTKPTPKVAPPPAPQATPTSTADSTVESTVAAASPLDAQAEVKTQAPAARVASTTRPLKRRLSRGQLRGIVKGYYRSLNQLMRQKRSYPRSARRLGLEGTVLVEMVVDKRGQIIDVKVVRSSGHDVLDRAALAQVQQIGRVPQIPSELNKPSMTFHIPFDYRLQS